MPKGFGLLSFDSTGPWLNLCAHFSLDRVEIFWLKPKLAQIFEFLKILNYFCPRFRFSQIFNKLVELPLYPISDLLQKK